MPCGKRGASLVLGGGAMWRWIIGILAALAIIAGAILVILNQVFSGISDSVTKVMPKGRLEQTTLAAHLGGVEAEAVLLQTDGLLIVTDMAAARNVPISYWKKNFLYSLVGASGCERARDVIGLEPLVAGNVHRPITTCAGEGTDFGGLAALARPAEPEFVSAISLAQWQALDARVGADPALFAANNQPSQAAFDYRCSFEFPYVWESDDASGTFLITRYRDAVAAALAGLPPGSFEMRLSNGYASTYVMYPAEGMQTSIEGWAVETSFTYILRDGEERKVPGLSFYRPDVRIDGDAAACAAFDAIDFAPLWQGDRDIALIEKAWADGVVQQAQGSGPRDWGDLTGAPSLRTAGVQNLFDYRYVSVK